MTTLGDLVSMSRTLGAPSSDFVILGEGNASARSGDGTFWVKASGTPMASADEDSFVEVGAAQVLSLLEAGALSEPEMRDRLVSAKLDADAPGAPSIETALHAVCLTLGGAVFVGHTHPTAVNAILCSQEPQRPFRRPIFPAESMICGQPVFVPYAPSGQPLAQAVRRALERFTAESQDPPRALLLQNHGLVAMGDSPQQVLEVTEMMVKTARILVRTYLLGGPRFVE